MEQKLQKFFIKHHIETNEIKYIKRENGKTNIFMSDGRIIDTFTPLKTILDQLPVDDFLNINKGVAISCNKIIGVKDDLYTMVDGMVFKGRSRVPRTIKYEQEKKYNKTQNPKALSIDYQCSIFDSCPLPFLLIGMEYNHNGMDMDFIIHYANMPAIKLIDRPQEKIINQSLHSLNIPTKQLIAIADIALNGGSRLFFSKPLQTWFQSYQPQDDFCAFIALPLDPEQEHQKRHPYQ